MHLLILQFMVFRSQFICCGSFYHTVLNWYMRRFKLVSRIGREEGWIIYSDRRENILVSSKIFYWISRSSRFAACYKLSLSFFDFFLGLPNLVKETEKKKIKSIFHHQEQRIFSQWTQIFSISSIYSIYSKYFSFFQRMRAR